MSLARLELEKGQEEEKENEHLKWIPRSMRECVRAETVCFHSFSSSLAENVSVQTRRRCRAAPTSQTSAEPQSGAEPPPRCWNWPEKHSRLSGNAADSCGQCDVSFCNMLTVTL